MDEICTYGRKTHFLWKKKNTSPPNPAYPFCGSRFFPRNSSSVIQSMQIKINGGIKVDIPDYNFVYNMLYDYTQGADALK